MQNDYKGPVCRGSFKLGTACRICERCKAILALGLSEQPSPYTCKHGCERDALKDTIEQQAAEIARLKREVMLQMGWKTEAQNEIERLREAGKKLNNHGCHDDDCQIVTHGVWSDPIPCTCGYEGAWKSWSAALGETE